MPYKFPNVSFDWLGDLPQLSEEARGRATRQELADLDMSTPAGMRKAADKLWKSGNLQNMEAAQRLYSSALGREQLHQKGEADRQYGEWLKTYRSGAAATPGTAPGAAPAPTVDIPLPPPPAQAPAVNWGGQGAVPGGPPLPPPAAPAPAAPVHNPNMTEAPQSPSDELLARTEGQGMPPRGPQLAQAGPGPIPGLTSPPGAPQVPGMEVFQGAQAQPMTTPQAPPAQLPPRLAGPGSEVDAARQEAMQAGSELIKMGPRMANTPAYKAYEQQFRSALARTKMSQSDQDYNLDRIQRAQRGQPEITKTDWELEKKIAPERYKEAEKVYIEQEKKGAQSQELFSTLKRLDEITKDPNFVSGKYAHTYGEIVNRFASIAKLTGIQAPDISALRAKVNSIAEPHLKAAALIEEFTSLSNNALMAHVGSFSKSFSDADRAFTERIFPQILQTPGGIAKIIDNLKAMAAYNTGIAKTARDYMKEHGNNATPYGVHEAVQKYAAENPLFVDANGKPTERGQAIITAAQPSARPAPQAPTAPPPMIRPQDEGRTGSTPDGRKWIIRNGRPVPMDQAGD